MFVRLISKTKYFFVRSCVDFTRLNIFELRVMQQPTLTPAIRLQTAKTPVKISQNGSEYEFSSFNINKIICFYIVFVYVCLVSIRRKQDNIYATKDVSDIIKTIKKKKPVRKNSITRSGWNIYKVHLASYLFM